MAVKKLTTKDEIVSAAQKLFIARGFGNVAMRDVASELKISVGNLTYHFKKKEALAEEVVGRLFASYKPCAPCKTLAEVDAWFTFLEKLGEKNAFYFKNYALFSGLSKKISKIQKQVFDDNNIFWEETFKNLVNAGLMQRESFKGQFAAAARDFHFIKIYWPERIEAERHMGLKLSSFSGAMWAILFPLFTPKGKKNYLNKGG